MFNVKILTPRRVIFKGNAWSVFFSGDQGEFEIQEFHKPIISVLRRGEIIIDWDKSISIVKGIMKMREDQVVALVEE